MICPKCGVQMFQDSRIGAGSMDEEYYSTMEIKKCGVCGRRFAEIYCTYEIGCYDNADNRARLVSDIREMEDKLDTSPQNILNN